MFSEEEINRLAARKANINSQKEMNTNSNPAPEGDVSGVKGHLAVYRVDAEGHEILMTEGQNTITDKGREYFSRLIGGLFTSGDETDLRPFAISMGSGSPHASPATQTDLVTLIENNGHALTSYNVLNRGFNSTELSIVNANQLQIEFTLVNEAAWLYANGGNAFSYNANLTEAGLFAEGLSGVGANGHSAGEMLAYKSLTVAYNSAETDFSILFRWTISFTNA